MNNPFSKNKQQTGLSGLVAGVTTLYANNVVDKQTSNKYLSLEGFDSVVASNMASDVGAYLTNLTNLAIENFGGVAPSETRLAAAGYAAAAFGDFGTYLNTAPVAPAGLGKDTPVVATSSSDSLAARPVLSMEAFNDRDIRSVQTYAAVYNLNAAVQDEFAETLFKTIAIPANDIGLVISARLMEVMTPVRHAVSGSVTQFNKKNLIKAIIDPTILHNDSNKIVPVVRTESAANFVATGDVAVRNILLDGMSIATAPLAVGKTFSLLGISQTDAALVTGNNDQTDELDTAISLKKIYLKTVNGSDSAVLSFDTSTAATSVFTPAPQGLQYGMNLNFDTRTIAVKASTKTITGSAPAGLGYIATNNLTVRLGLRMNGTTNVETSETTVAQSGAITVVSVTQQDGTVLAPTDTMFTNVVALFANASIIGFDLDAQRTNSNLRQLDQLLTTTYYNQMYTCGWRTPISVQRPLTADASNDNSDLATMIFATHARTSAAAVNKLFQFDAIMSENLDGASDADTVMPEIFGVGRHLLARAYYKRDTLDVLTTINTISSHDRARDISAVLINMIRAHAYDAYNKSGYRAAADARAGGTAPTPILVIATDEPTMRYLMIEGETRIAGITFDVKVVSTLNKRMAGKIFLTFVDPTSLNTNEPSPLSFGNMIWKPEAPQVVTPMHRQGATIKHLSVAPAFEHIVNLPILVRIDVENLPETSKGMVPVNFHTI